MANSGSSISFMPAFFLKSYPPWSLSQAMVVFRIFHASSNFSTANSKRLQINWAGSMSVPKQLVA